jgi:hypothetical protein
VASQVADVGGKLGTLQSVKPVRRADSQEVTTHLGMEWTVGSGQAAQVITAKAQLESASDTVLGTMRTVDIEIAILLGSISPPQ